jgi:U3 small nucleolar ribonucleoprotein protein IMP3
MRRYHLQKRSDYQAYARIVGQITKLANKLSLLPPNSATRKELADKLVEKLYAMGIISVKSGLSVCQKIGVSAFCRRRLAIVMMRLRMAETMREAVTLIEQGHVRVGPVGITDPAFLVTRRMEDFITWAKGSKIKTKIAKYNDKLDDYDLLADA